MTKKTLHIRVDPETKERLKEMKQQLQPIENNDISLGEVIKRMCKGEDVLIRLKSGSLERKLGFKK